MEMKNKEQLLYFFLQGKISLSQYDYKFMANLQTMITNTHRVTTNQADLFDKLISKYNKQLTKNGYSKDLLVQLPWKTDLLESTDEYTGAMVSLFDNEITIRTPFNKAFITAFRNSVLDNPYEWDKETKRYRATFSTTAFKIAATILKDFFPTVKFTDNLQAILDSLKVYDNTIWNPTVKMINGRMIMGAANEILGDMIQDMEFVPTPTTLFKLTQMGINIDSSIYQGDSELEFAASRVYQAEITDIEPMISWMKMVGCENVIIGRGLRNKIDVVMLTTLVSKYGMKLVTVNFGSLPEGTSIMLQHTSSVDQRHGFSGIISKTVVLKDSRPIEVK